ncbi:hypothetical protein LJC48_03760 [Desulfovibrio sp. OttesenSCG-928-C06]|nr:hypothetical protein [Desulfovibrio sp. OttesenSCG-928-C06]
MLPEFKDTAICAARAAGSFLLQLSEVEVCSAEGRDIKLYADKKSEEILLAHLSPTGIPVLSEETPADDSTMQGMRWIIDPLDGSYNLFKGMRDLCCVSVALWDGVRPLLGVVYRFASDELYVGVPGEGAYLNNQRVQSSAVQNLNQASLATGFPVNTDFDDSSTKQHMALLQYFKKVRMLGSAALMCSFVGSGRIDVYAERKIFIWDIAAALAIVLAGGGVYDCVFLDKHMCDVSAFANKSLQNCYASCLCKM